MSISPTPLQKSIVFVQLISHTAVVAQFYNQYTLHRATPHSVQVYFICLLMQLRIRDDSCSSQCIVLSPRIYLIPPFTSPTSTTYCMVYRPESSSRMSGHCQLYLILRHSWRLAVCPCWWKFLRRFIGIKYFLAFRPAQNTNNGGRLLERRQLLLHALQFLAQLEVLFLFDISLLLFCSVAVSDIRYFSSLFEPNG